MTEPISLAFDLIRRYAEREGWIPIGWREWTVGPWRITVNGTNQKRAGISPYHALIQHDEYVGLMLINPFGGTVGGWKDTENEFVAAMEAALAQPADAA